MGPRLNMVNPWSTRVRSALHLLPWRVHPASMTTFRRILIALVSVLACAAFAAAAVGAGTRLLGEGRDSRTRVGVERRNPSASSSTTLDHEERTLSCQEAQQLLIDTATRLQLSVGSDPDIIDAPRSARREQKLRAAIDAETEKLRGITVEPDCG